MKLRDSVLILAGGALLSTAVVVPAHALSGSSAAPAYAKKSSSAKKSSAKKAAAKKKAYTTHYCYGRTVRVDDGDTIDVKLSKACKGLGWKKGKVVVVRNAAIQATEVKHAWAKKECWGNESRKLMRKEFPKHSRVRLGAYARTKSDTKTADGRTRYVMYAYAKRGGHWVDAQSAVVSAGLAFPKGEHVEAAHNNRYVKLAQKAIALKKGMWGDPDHCGSYAPGAKLQAWTGWKTNGRDSKATANTEWFKVRNVGSVAVPLYHWQVRDGSHSFGGGKKSSFVINQHVTLKPGQTMTLHPGKGTNDPANLVWYNNHPRLPFYPNVHAKPLSDAGAGKTKTHPPYGYITMLMDPARDMRAVSLYGCMTYCAKPSVRVTSVDPKGGSSLDETATVTNTSRSPIAMTGIVVQISSATHEFPSGMVLGGGQSVTVHFNRSGSDSTRGVYFGNRGTSVLRDAGGKVWLRTADGTTLTMYKWGDGGSYVF